MSDSTSLSQVELIREALLENERLPVPDPVDVVVVGAGAAGIGVAFRAHELGLSVLIVDRDDLLSVLRDWVYSVKDYVDADYNSAARKTPFPRGGELVASLTFENHSLASELYHRWVKVVVDNKLPVRTGAVLTDLVERPDGTVEVRASQAGNSLQFVGRTVVLAIGGGLPTRLPVLGEVEGIASKVGDGKRFVDGPACVIGGGTSAAEAVIAIAALKQKAEDPNPVYWSYRAEALPKVNDSLDKRLAETFRAGGFRYLPNSQAKVVLDVGAGKNYLLVQEGRMEQPKGPVKSQFVEFEVERVLACLGSQPNTDFLHGLGIEELTAVDQEVDALAVTPWYETARKNVFLVGDALAPAYIQTTDFRPEADQVAVVQRPGCFKMSMRDGVLAAEAVGARLRDGADDRQLLAKINELMEAWKEGFVPAGRKKAAAPAPKQPEVQPAVAVFEQVIAGATNGPVVKLPVGEVWVDASSGQLAEAAGPNYARVNVTESGAFASDPDRTRGVMLRVGVEHSIVKNRQFYVGNQVVCVADSQGATVLAMLDPGTGQPRRWLPVAEGGQDFGRQDGNSVLGLEPSDEFLSRRHFRISGTGNVFALKDYGSKNGTFLEVGDSEEPLVAGDVLWVGQHSLHFKGMEGGGLAAAAAVAEPAAAPAAAAPAAAAASAGAEPAAAAPAVAEPAAAGGGIQVAPQGQALELVAGKSMLTLFEGAGLATKDADDAQSSKKCLWSCGGVPSCYLCLVKVAAGGENLSEASKKEMKGIKLKVAGLSEEGLELSAKECRLACMAEAKGAVQIELLGDTDL